MATTMTTVRVADLALPFEERGLFTRRVLLDSDVAAYVARFDRLPAHDRFGYEIAYYVGGPMLSYDPEGNLCVDVDATDGVVLRELLGDALCAGCASAAPDFAYYVAYQINGEIGDCEAVHCDECGAVIVAGGGCD